MMVRGKYLKSAERACATKARFDSRETAERTAEYRYRAYPCPICHQWHLTSQNGPAIPPPPEKPAPPLARLGDLEWKELKPRGEPSRLVKPPRPEPKEASVPSAPEVTEAIVRTVPDRHHRVHLVLNMKLVKSDPVGPELRKRLRIGDTVTVEGHNITAIWPTIEDSI